MGEKKKRLIEKLLFFMMILMFLPVFSSSHAYASAEAGQWDSTWHTSKDGLYSYYVSKDQKSAKLFYYEGPWNIDKLVIPATIDGYTVTAIGNQSMYPNTLTPFHYIKDTVEEIVLPDTVTSLDAGVFSGLEKLKKIKLPDQIREIPDELFCGDINLQSFHFRACHLRIVYTESDYCCQPVIFTDLSASRIHTQSALLTSIAVI
jgi:hypothetical protein